MLVIHRPTQPVLNRAHPLLAHADHAWFPYLGTQGNSVPSLEEYNTGLLTGGPIWTDTPFGRGVQTDNLKYIDLRGTKVGAPLTCFVAYVYRYDASTAGSATETGILYSGGLNGLSFRHNGTTVEALKSHVASLATGTVAAPARGQFHTAAVTIGYGSIPTITIYYDGRRVNSATNINASTLTGDNSTALGYDHSLATPEYGRHTIMFAIMSGRRVYSATEIRALDDIARLGFFPFWIRPLQTLGTESASGVSDWSPQYFPLAPRPLQPAEFFRPILNPALFPEGGDFAFLPKQPPLYQRPPARYIDPFFYRQHFPVFGYTPNPLPPGPGKGTATPFIRRLPLESEERRLLRVHDQISSLANSLIGQGMLRQLTPDQWQIIGGAFVSPSPPTPAHDVTQGFVPGSAFLDDTAGKIYFCWSNAENAAVWLGPLG